MCSLYCLFNQLLSRCSFLDQMRLSIAGVSIGSYVVAFVLHHSLFGQFTCMFLVGTVFMIIFCLLPLIVLLPFRWLVSSLFLLFRWDSQLLESMLYTVRLRWSYITYLYMYILLLVLFQAVLPCGCVWCLVRISIDIAGMAKFNFAVVQYINDACVLDNTFLKCKFYRTLKTWIM